MTRRVRVHLDRETSERAGAGGMFQIVSITGEDDEDLTHLVDLGIHFHDLGEVERYLSDLLGEDVEVEEV